MFKKKDYINVRGIGKIHCKTDLSLMDVRMICVVAAGIPFVDEINEDGSSSGKQEFFPEATEYAVDVALLSVATDYDFNERDVWNDLHMTSLSSAIRTFYSLYFDEIYNGAMSRIHTKAISLEPANEAAIFSGIAKQLEGVDIMDILSFASAVSQMSEKELVKAALETDAP